MSSDYDIELWLLLEGFEGSPDEITRQLGVVPDRSRKKDEVIRKHLKAKRSYWRVSSPEPSGNSTIERQWNGLTQLLADNMSVIKELPASMGKRALFIVYAHKYIPGLEIPVHVMKALADHDLNIDISIYDWIELPEET